MPVKTPFHNPIKYLIGGSNPSIFESISEELTKNYLVIDDSLVPCHGKINPRNMAGKIQTTYKSFKDNTVYIVAGNQGYTLDFSGNLQNAFFLDQSAGYIQIDENNNSELAITTGAALYIYNYGPTPPAGGRLTKIPVVTSDGFLLNNPCTVVCISTFFFVGDAYTSRVQISTANNGTSWNPVQIFNFTSNADNIVSLAESERVLFINGKYTMERWVVNGNVSVVTRDNVFLKQYGLYDVNSFSNKMEIFIGLYSGETGALEVKIFEDGRFGKISSPGIIKKIMAAGKILNADIYEIDSIRYYELVCQNLSFIYNFYSSTWTYSTNYFEQVVLVGGPTPTYYVASADKLYTLDKYETKELKVRQCTNAFIAPEYERFTIDQCFIWFSNPRALPGTFRISAKIDGIQDIAAMQEISINNNKYYSNVSRVFGMDCWQFGLYFETYENVIIRAFSAGTRIGGAS